MTSTWITHVLSLRIAFLATRNWTGAGESDEPVSPRPDQLLDFNFRARKDATHLYLLPGGTNEIGAMIMVVQ